MAVNDMVVRILGDSRSVERAFARSSNAATQFNRNIETTGTKIDKTSKKFSSFAKGTAVGFGGAFALTQAVDVIRNLATVAAESEQVLGQTQVALESTGKSWAKYGEIIKDTVKTQSRLGFDDEALLRTFSNFQRTTGDVTEALRLNNLAMDVARARFIDLEQAAALVTKAAIGNAGALRRLGIDAKVGSTGVELLALLQDKYGGAAEKAGDDAATSFERTQVAMENLQESLGTLLLPALELMADRFQTAAEFAENLSTALGKIGSIKIPEIELPFNITIGGKSLGDIAGDAAGIAKFTPLNPLFGLTIANSIANQFRDQTEKAKPNLAKAMNDAMEDLVSDSLSAAGTFGITKLPTGGKDLALKFSSGIAGAIEAAQALASRTINTGKARIAAEKAAEATAKAQEAAEKAAEKELARRRAARAKEQARQFRQLGLSVTGEEIVPGVRNLQQRVAGALRRVGTGELDIGSKLVDRLKLARKLLKTEGGKLTEDTRRVINDLLKTLNQGKDKLEQGPLTKTTGLNADKFLAGLGLSPEQTREARARLSGLNSAGRQLSGNRRPTGSFTGGPVVTSETTVNVNLDGETVGRNVTRTQQKQKRRNPKQKRGPRSGV